MSFVLAPAAHAVQPAGERVGVRLHKLPPGPGSTSRRR